MTAGRTRTAIVALALSIGALFALAAPASAKLIHEFEGSFDGSGTPAGSFGPSVAGVAVDNSSSASAGRVYVADFAHRAIDRFEEEPSGSHSFLYDCQITGLGELSASPSECDTSAAGPGSFANVYGIATDPSTGSLYSAELGSNEKQTLSFSGAVNGVTKFRLTFEGELTAEITYSSTAATLRSRIGTALGALPAVGGPTNLRLTGTVTSVAVEFKGTLSYTNVGQMTGSGVTVSTSSQGRPSVIDRFSFAGAFEKQHAFSGAEVQSFAVSAATHNLFVAVAFTAVNNNPILEWDPATEAVTTFSTGADRPGGPFGSIGGLAVDNSPSSPNYGDVYVPDVADRNIDRFDASGAYLCQITGRGEESTSSSECDSAAPGLPGGSFGMPIAVAVDPSNGRLYVADLGRHALDEFEPSGAFINEVPVGGASPSMPAGVAVNASNGDLYVPDLANNVVNVYGRVFIPDITTGSVSDLGETTATPHGEVDPEASEGGSPIESCEFEYGTTAAYGQSAPCSPATPYSNAIDVSGDLTGLVPATTYHYRLVAENQEARVGQGEDRTFVTRGPPSISGELSIARTSSATVKAQINPFGYETTCLVQYVSDAAFQASEYENAAAVPCEESLTAGFENQVATASLTGLEIGTVYHFRFVAHNAALSEGGTATGVDQAFSTFGLESVSIEALEENGDASIRAGGHPYEMKVSFALETTAALTDEYPASVIANLRTVRVQLPPGLIGNPLAVPRCPAYDAKPWRCAPDMQIGLAQVFSSRGGEERGSLYNLQPPDGVAAQIGGVFNSFGLMRIDASVRSGGDYGINADTLSVTTDDSVSRVVVTLWGTPADDGHDAWRRCRSGVPGCPSEAPLLPFLTNPTSCTGPLTGTLSVDSWQEPGNFVSKDATLPAMEGCDQLDFSPVLEARPTTNVADSPSGLKVDLHIPQNEAACDPGPPVDCGTAEANLKDATVRLPEGLVVNPSGANGLDACTAAQIGYKPGTSGPAEFSPGPAQCPDASRIGNVEIDTPLLDHPLPGSVYVAKPHDNPFDSLLALYIAVYDPVSGVVVKLPGHVVADPSTGQLTTTFQENPQLPFEDLKLKLFGGAAAPLRTPPACGTYSTMSSLTPWSAPESGPPATPFDSYILTQGPNGTCANTAANQPFDPGFDAGTITPIAGSYSPFVIHLRREDGSQQFSQLTVTPPPGLLGKLAGVPYCPEAAIAAAAKKSGSAEKASPSCPAASHVGVVEVGAGAGPAPYWVQGQAYLAGPYKGAPLSLAILTPATAGPFDLGTVVTRVALKVDPETAQITAVSDPIPSILEGIPLDVRTISVKLDRPEFTLNPTSCDPMQVGGAAVSTLGQSAPLTDPFQLGECAPLGFKPKLSLRLEGGSTRGKHPALRATLRMPPGGANIARASVTLPHSEFLDQGHIRTVCTRVQFAADACPQGSIYGHARAFTPLLDKPLEGPVYLRSSSHKLPDLVAALNGQIQIVLVGRIDSVRGGIRTTFEAVPDAPVSKFVLEMQGGHKGLLQNSTDVCASTNRATAKFNAQNGKVSDTEPAVKAQCAKPHRKAGKGHKRRAGRASRKAG